MSDFITILRNIVVASSPNGVTTNNGYQNIEGIEFLANLKRINYGKKDGSHFLRTYLRCDDSNQCLPRKDCNVENVANFVILDCDKHIDRDDKKIDGAPDAKKISGILRIHNISHVLYGSFSHYIGNIGNRYRIIIPTNRPYTKEQLSLTVESIITLINSNLDDELLVNAKENNTWSQPWYYPRKPIGSNIDNLYFEYLDGKAIEITGPVTSLTNNFIQKNCAHAKNGQIPPIDAFNKQFALKDLLHQYGYKKVYVAESGKYEKWLSPQSRSGRAGITVIDNKFFSHHQDAFNDGYWHDAFDLMRVHEELTDTDAVKTAAQKTLILDGRTVDQYNKSITNKNRENEANLSSHPIPHNSILKQLLNKIISINFREKAKLGEKDKLKLNHLHIIVIETILELAKHNNWGICRNHDFIYLYNGAYWSLINEDELKAFLSNAAEIMSVDKYTSLHFSFRDQLYKQFIALAHLPKPKLSRDIVFINLKNGTFEITPKNTRLKPFSRDDFITYQLPFEYNPDAIARLFEEYLDKVLPDKKLQNILAEYLGYVFIRTSTLKLEKTLLLYGKGANGKSVFYEIVRSLFGEQNTSEYSLQNLTNDSGYQRAMIAHKLVNYASEINGRLEASIFKQLVSGEPVEARLPYGNPFIMTDYAKLIFNCNELPRDVEYTEAYFRRFLIIPFNITIPENEQDKQLAQKIIDKELSGIFNWVLRGLNRLLEQEQFTDSEIVRDIRKQYENESDSVRLFIDESGYKSSPTGYVMIKALYQEYRTYCQDEGFKPVSNVNFRKRLEYFNIVIEKKNIGKVAFVTKLVYIPTSYKQAGEK
jgi:P4 family phage/plasmid primase-like protien